MRTDHSAQLRVLYIILVPIVLLIIILNTGILQKAFPAARVHGRSYSVVRYNYYYYDNYNDFLDENEYALDELGYNPKISANNQDCSLENGEITWKEYFQRGGERNMAETQYYCDLAEAAGYTFTEEELEPVRDRLAENAAFQTANNISAKNYYIAYYGSGVTEALYTAELTRQVKAQVYKTVLARSAPAPSAGETPDGGGSYRAVDIRVITLDAVPDRETGEIGQAQLDALGEKLRRLSVRYAAGESFEALQTAFSTRRLGDKSGVLTDATRADLPEAAAKELLDDQTSLSAGQTVTAIDETTGTAYFILLDGFGASGAELEAALTAGLRAVEAEAEAALASDYTVERLKPGILLATG